MNKKTTIDELAVLMEKGFKRQDKRTDGVLEAMNKFAVSVDKRFDGVDKRFDFVEAKIDNMEQKMDSEFYKLRVELNEIWSKLEDIEKRLEQFSKTSKEDADAFGGDILGLRHRVEFLENKFKELQTV